MCQLSLHSLFHLIEMVIGTEIQCRRPLTNFPFPILWYQFGFVRAFTTCDCGPTFGCTLPVRFFHSWSTIATVYTATLAPFLNLLRLIDWENKGSGVFRPENFPAFFQQVAPFFILVRNKFFVRINCRYCFSLVCCATQPIFSGTYPHLATTSRVSSTVNAPPTVHLIFTDLRDL